MLPCLIIAASLLVFMLIFAVCEDHPESGSAAQKTTARATPNQVVHAVEVPKEDKLSRTTFPTLNVCPDQNIDVLLPKPIDPYVESRLGEKARTQGFGRFQVLGACAPGHASDMVAEGTIFSVQVANDFIWVFRDNGTRVGMFPPDVAKSYLKLPLERRYSQVVVAHSVNLGDKYGQCFVYPLLVENP